MTLGAQLSASFSRVVQVPSVLGKGQIMASFGIGNVAKPPFSPWLKQKAEPRKGKGAPGSCCGKGLARCLKAWSFLSKLTPASSHAPNCPIVIIIWTWVWVREAGHLPETVKSQQMAQPVGNPKNASHLCPILKPLHISYCRSSPSAQRDSDSLQSNSWFMIGDRMPLGTSILDPVLFLQTASYLIPPTLSLLNLEIQWQHPIRSWHGEVYLALTHTHTYFWEIVCIYFCKLNLYINA